MARPGVAARLLVFAAALAAAVAVVALLVMVAPGRRLTLPSGSPPSFPVPTAGTEILVGAGDIADCDSNGDEATARLLDGIEGTVFTVGDNAYDRGRPEEFRRCYEPTWGRHLTRTRFPVAGNHDWDTSGAAGYLDYFGSAARPAGTTWYSGDLGAWHVIVLDSDCTEVGGCGEGSAQLDWLRADLDASDANCTLALWHHPRFTSGDHRDDPRLDPFWRALHDAGAEVVVSAHDHDYERFAPQDPDAQSDPERGLRQFVVGTGGSDLRGFREPRPNSEVRSSVTHGVLRLELAPTGYSWQFVPVAGGSFTDSGSGTCH